MTLEHHYFHRPIKKLTETTFKCQYCSAKLSQSRDFRKSQFFWGGGDDF